MKKILIVGKGSYIGTAFEEYVRSFEYDISVLDTLGNEKDSFDYSGYDSIFYVAGIVHRKKNEVPPALYYEVNRDLTLEIAKKAKASGVGQFIYLSSMSVYGKTMGAITKDTPATPGNDYGKSKLEAEKLLMEQSDESFRVCILRPPMVYGRGCKGNYNTLASFVKKMPVFPKYANKRSMIFVGNLCEFVKFAVESSLEGVYLPQNKETVCTSDMAAKILEVNGKKQRFTPVFNPFLKIFGKLKVEIVVKCFGDLWYETPESPELVDKFPFDLSIELTEK